MVLRLLTFDHDHIDIDGAHCWLGETFSLLQPRDHIYSADIFVRSLAVGKQFPHRHTCNRNDTSVISCNVLK